MQVAQVLARDELEDEVGDVVVVVELEEIDDVGIVGFGQQPCLLAKSLQGLGPARPLGAQNLEGDDGSARRVLGPVDSTLTAFSQQLEETEPAQGFGERTGERRPAECGTRCVLVSPAEVQR